MEIDRHVVPGVPQALGERQVIGHARETAAASQHHDLVQMWVAAKDRRG